jgi:heat shock protein HtpX
MTAALRRLQSEMNTPSDLPGELTAFGIRPGGSKFGQLLSSHPPLDKRIEALQNR